MTRPTVKIKSATIITKKSIHLLIVPTRIKKRTKMTTIPSTVKKVKPVIKTYTQIRRRLNRPYQPYKLRLYILKRKNKNYQNHMESHTQIHFSIEGQLLGDGT